MAAVSLFWNTNIAALTSWGCFHLRGQHLCKFIGTKESVCIRQGLNSHRISLGHQHRRREVMWKHSIALLWKAQFISNGDLFTCEDNMLFSRVKISCFRAMIFHWCLYSKKSSYIKFFLKKLERNGPILPTPTENEQCWVGRGGREIWMNHYES